MATVGAQYNTSNESDTCTNIYKSRPLKQYLHKKSHGTFPSNIPDALMNERLWYQYKTVIHVK